MADEVVLPIPNLELAQQLFILSSQALKHLHDEARQKLVDGIKTDNIAPYYRSITSATPPVLPVDKDLLATMEKANEDDILKLNDRLEQAEKTEGEMEISDVLRGKANYLTRIGESVSLLLCMK